MNHRLPHGVFAAAFDGTAAPAVPLSENIVAHKIRMTPDGRVTSADAAVFLGVANQTLRNWRCIGRGPKPIRICGKVFYLLADLRAFVARTDEGGVT